MAKIQDITPKDFEIIPSKDKIMAFDLESDTTEGLASTVGGLGKVSTSAVNKAINTDGSINSESIPDEFFNKLTNTIDDVLDGVAYAKVLATSLSEGVVLLSAASGNLDNILDGETYARVLLADLSGGHIILGNTVGDLDDITDGTNYAKVLATDIGAGHILLAEATGNLDDIIDGSSYGKVLLTDLSAGHILLSETVGDLDDIVDGTNYAKVASTSIDAGKIVVAGLDSGVTARMFTDSNTKVNVEAWKHANDVTLIDGGKIYTGSITALGIVTAGAFVCSTEGYIRGGQTDYNTGIGFFLGYATDAYKFSVGNPASDYLTYDGSILTVNASRIIKLLTAGMAITAGEMVYIATDGKIYSTDGALQSCSETLVGIAVENISSGSLGKVQTFGNVAGLSGLSAGSIYYLSNATHTIDQQQATINANITLNGVWVWQSFTTGSINNISKIVARLVNVAGYDRGLTVKIYSGEGVGGTLLYTGTQTVPTGFDDNLTHNLTQPVPVSSSTLYTVALYADGDVRWRYNTAGGYASGRFSTDAAHDGGFQTLYSTSRGLIGTSAGTYSKKVGFAISTTELSLKDAA